MQQNVTRWRNLNAIKHLNPLPKKIKSTAHQKVFPEFNNVLSYQLVYSFVFRALICFILVVANISSLTAQISPNFVNQDLYPGAVGSVTVTIPPSSNPGDLVMVFIGTDDDGAITEPASFSNLYEFWTGTAGPTAGVYYRIIDGTEDPTYSFSFPSEPTVVTTIRFDRDKIDSANPIHAMANNSGTSNNPQAPSITTGIENLSYFQYVAIDGASAGVLSSNSATATILATDQSGNSGGVETMLVSEIQATAGATPMGSFSFASEQWATVAFALNPSPLEITGQTGGDCNNAAATLTLDYEAANAAGTFELRDPANAIIATEAYSSTTGSISFNFNVTTNGAYTVQNQGAPLNTATAYYYPTDIDSDNDGVCDLNDLDDDNDGISDIAENAICTAFDYTVVANKQNIELSATANTSGDIQVLLDGNASNNNFYYPDVSIVDKEIVRLKFPKPLVLTGIEFQIGDSYMFNTGATTRMQASSDGTSWIDISPDYVKMRPPNNTPGVISSAPHAETFQWSNSTPYQYYRLYGIAGNTNQNPWINELHFQVSNGICDLDQDGVPNQLDLDSDNDGIPDNVEGQPTLTYVAPNNDTPAQYLTNNGINSAYGTGLVPPNQDGDFCEDFLDIDTDNDGTEDKEESGLLLTAVFGANGLDNNLEGADDYSDANGNINDPKNDLAGSDPGIAEVYYRQIPTPGGVALGLELWTLPNSITYDATNDNIITRVEDFSGTIAADQTYGLFDFISGDPKIIEAGINFNPNIEFDGNDWFRKEDGFNTNTWTEGERFTVMAENEEGYNGNNGFVTDFAAKAGGAHYTFGNKGIYHQFGSSDRHSWNSTTGANLESNGTHQGFLFDTRSYLIDNVWSATNDWGNDVNGNPTYRDATNTPNFAMTHFHWGAVHSATYYGNSPEVFFYSRKVNDQERLRINTYLGIKYGITLGSETNLVNYLDSKGEVIWTANADYQNNIAGIGQDNASGLSQKQSTTINATNNVVMYLGDHTGTDLPATNKLNTQSFPNNGDFMVWGDNNESLGFLTSYTPNSFTPDGPYFAMERVWIIQEKTGNVGTVTVKAPTGATYLLVHNSANFSTGTPTEVALTEDAFGNLLATYDFSDGDYFTFIQEPPPAPGGIAHELGVWLRADKNIYSDAGTTNAITNNPVQQWNTQIGEDHTTQTTANQQPIYKDGSQTEAINFNPGVVFDGSNDELHFPSRLGVTGTNNFTIFAAGKVSSGGAKRIFGPASSGNNAYEMDINKVSAVQARVAVIAEGVKETEVNEAFVAFTSRDGNTFSVATNGEVPVTGNNTKNFTSTNNYDLGSSYNTNPDFHGTLGEFVVYQGAKTSDDIQKIQTYLALKYGATLDTNYVASSGTTIWSKDSIYNQAIAGIGYDKAAGLLQKQSWSTVDTTIAIGLGNIFASNQVNPAVFENNLSFLVWGSNGATTAIDTMITPLISSMKRVWKVANIQSIEDVVARVHSATLGVTDETPIIIVSSDEIIDENDTIYSLSESGDYFKGTINLPDGMYFTIGLKAPQPLMIPIKYSRN